MSKNSTDHDKEDLESQSENSFELTDDETVQDVNDNVEDHAKPLSDLNLKLFQEKHDNSGVVYISRVPPHMRPHKLKTLLQSFGEIGRIYLASEDDKRRKNRVRAGGTRRKQFLEGWIEFMDKKVAKLVAESLNGTQMGGKKKSFYYEDLWNLKYLPRFKWVHLREQIAYERIARQKKMQVEMDQARKEIGVYLQNVDKSKMIEAMEEKKRRRNPDKVAPGEANEDERSRIRRKFRQRKTVDGIDQQSSASKIARIMGKLLC